MIQEVPESQFPDDVFLSPAKLAVGVGTDIQEEAAAFGSCFGEEADHMEAGLVGLVGGLVLPRSAQGDAAFPCEVHADAGELLLGGGNSATGDKNAGL